MAEKNSSPTGGIGLGGVLLAIFVTLKLCGVIEWSWWWVLAPMWLPLAIIGAVLAVGGLALVVMCICSKRGKRA